MNPPQELVETIRAGGLIRQRTSGVAMISGGPDSACLLAGLVGVLGPDGVDAVHLNYRLRPDSDLDEEVCRDLCGRLRVDLRVERPTLPGGNVQAAARKARYEAAERLRARYGADWIATGHSRTDLAETVVYRLATSPGRRALLGLAPRRGRLVRPLLEFGRERLRELADSAHLPYRDDPSNLDMRFARNRIRAEVLPVLRSLSPEAERNIALTWREVAEEADALEGMAASVLSGTEPAAPTTALERLHPAVRRAALRIMAERASGAPVPIGIDRAAEIWRVAGNPEGGIVELPGSVRAVCEAGWIVFAAAGHEPHINTAEVQPPPLDETEAPSVRVQEPWPAVELEVPGTCRWGSWELRAEVRPERPTRPEGPDVAMLDARALGGRLTVRGRRDGDRMEPLGLGGSKSLQDLFTDRGVPRSHRRIVPVVSVGDEIAWVAGVAIGDRFKIRAGTTETAVITATPVRS